MGMAGWLHTQQYLSIGSGLQLREAPTTHLDLQHQEELKASARPDTPLHGTVPELATIWQAIELPFRKGKGMTSTWCVHLFCRMRG